MAVDHHRSSQVPKMAAVLDATYLLTNRVHSVLVFLLFLFFVYKQGLSQTQVPLPFPSVSIRPIGKNTFLPSPRHHPTLVTLSQNQVTSCLLSEQCTEPFPPSCLLEFPPLLRHCTRTGSCGSAKTLNSLDRLHQSVRDRQTFQMEMHLGSRLPLPAK